MSYKIILTLGICICCRMAIKAQENERVKSEQCGTMQRLSVQFERNPELQLKFESQRREFNRAVKDGSLNLKSSNIPNNNMREDQAMRSVYTIPVVFHIVLSNPTVITDRQLQSQLDTLNKDFFGINGDSINVPSYFRPLFGRSGIQFCLAQRTPEGESTTGIERITTTRAAFSNTNDDVKHLSSGGADIWDNNKYFNVWITSLSNGVVGYASFPDDGQPNEQGVVIDYRAMPGASFEQYNGGKTLTHETGHYFNLYHIWGDDGGACTGTDFVDDTPNQADASKGCFSLVKTDNCTTGGNGIMYQNYMDYTNDNCLVMFSAQQVTRMENALFAYRSSLLNSDGCQPPIIRNYDVELKVISQPTQRVCANAFTPVVLIKNRGTQTLTSLIIEARIDDGNISFTNWTGTLPKSAGTEVTLAPLNSLTGTHTLTIFISRPNNNIDEDPSNDTLSLIFQYNQAITGLSESFETNAFFSQGWDIVNPDNSITWKRVPGIAKTGTSSMMIDNFSYAANGQKDDLRFPDLTISNVDSAYLSFQVAAATNTTLATTNNNWDTLEVLVSRDCGQSYTSIYRKFGSTLVTKTNATATAFIPASSEWRKDSINMAPYIGSGQIMIAFRNTSEYENNIYLDDINLRTVTINKNLKAQGFLVTPNPATSFIAVQFYPQPVNLKGVQLYNTSGQKIAEIQAGGQASNYYSFDISRYPAGTYIIRAIFSDRVVTKKILKY